MSQPHYAGRRINARGIIYHDGKLLAVKHISSNGETAAYYAVPGGGVDPMESITQGLERELVEELGIRPVVGKLLFIQQYRSGRAGFEEELEFFFAVDNPKDFENPDIASTSHGSVELAVCEFVNPHEVTIYPKFLQTIELDNYVHNVSDTVIFDNFHEDD